MMECRRRSAGGSTKGFLSLLLGWASKTRHAGQSHGPPFNPPSRPFHLHFHFLHASAVHRPFRGRFFLSLISAPLLPYPGKCLNERLLSADDHCSVCSPQPLPTTQHNSVQVGSGNLRRSCTLLRCVRDAPKRELAFPPILLQSHPVSSILRTVRTLTGLPDLSLTYLGSPGPPFQRAVVQHGFGAFACCGRAALTQHQPC